MSTGSVESGGRGAEQSGRDRSADGLEASRDEGHKILKLRVVAVLQPALDPVDAVDHGTVMAAAETGADLREGRLGEIAREVHGDVARVGHVLSAAIAAQIVDVQAELAGDLCLLYTSPSPRDS